MPTTTLKTVITAKKRMVRTDRPASHKTTGARQKISQDGNAAANGISHPTSGRPSTKASENPAQMVFRPDFSNDLIRTKKRLTAPNNAQAVNQKFATFAPLLIGLLKYLYPPIILVTSQYVTRNQRR